MKLKSCVLFLLSVFSAGALAQTRPFTAMDLVNLDRVSDPHISPDGHELLYSLRSTDYDANKGVFAIWLADLNSGVAPRRLAISEGGATNPRWSPDGRAIYFLSNRSGSSQVWRTDIAGSATVQVTHLPLDVNTFVLSPDNHRLVVAMAVFPGCESPQCTYEREQKRKAEKSSGQVFDTLYPRRVAEWVDGTRNHLFALTFDASGVTAGDPLPLMADFNGDTPNRPWGSDSDISISPDGKTIFFCSEDVGHVKPWSYNTDIFRVPMDGSAPPVNLTITDSSGDTAPKISPDGHFLAYLSQSVPGPAAQQRISILDLSSGAKRDVTPKWDRSVHEIEWSSDHRSILAIAEEHGTNVLYRVQLDNDSTKPLTSGGSVEGYDSSADATVFVHSSFSAPPQIFLLKEGQQPAQITSLNTSRLAGIQLANYHSFSFTGWNGDTVTGVVFEPANYQPGHKYPVVFAIHGGPQEAWDDAWTYRWNPQTFAGAGYAVVEINPHGSSGYGEAFMDAVLNHWGDRPLEDLQKGWQYALTNFSFLDGSRACAIGPSYGGYMIDWIAGVWNKPWRCLIAHDGVFDLRMQSYASDISFDFEFGAAVAEDPEDYERFNPIDHVKDWSKPILIIHSGRDFRVPLEQGIGAFTAARLRGVPSELLYFPDEEHAVLKPQNSVQWQTTVNAWVSRWTQAQP